MGANTFKNNSFLLQGYNKINSIVDVLTEHTPVSCLNQVLDFFPGLKILILYFFMDVASSSHHFY